MTGKKTKKLKHEEIVDARKVMEAAAPAMFRA